MTLRRRIGHVGRDSFLSLSSPEEVLRGTAVFAPLSKRGLGRLAAAAVERFVPTQEVFFTQGGTDDRVFILVDGRVDLFGEWAGRQGSIMLLNPGASFILAACVSAMPYLLSARSIDPCRLLVLPGPEIRGLMGREPAFATAVAGQIAGDFRAMVRHAKALRLRTATERTAAKLLQLTEDQGEGGSCVLPLRKRQLASYLGVAPESLSRVLRSLEKAGVRTDGASITVTDRALLEGIARTDPWLDGEDPRQESTTPPPAPGG